MSDKIKTIAGYIRVSSEDQRREGYSLTAQRNKIIEYCNLNNFNLIDVYEDAGISGGSISKRPAFKKLIEDARNKKFNGILVFKFDRAFRNLKDAVITLDEFRKIDIDFISITENIDTTTAMGNAMFGIIGVFAQLERDLTSERMDSIFWQKFNEGKSIGRCPLGYKWDKKNKIMILDPKKSIEIKEIFNMAINKVSYKLICSKFNLKPQSYYNIIKNPVYCGYIKFEDKIKIGQQDKIISIETFKLLNKNFKYDGN